MKSYSEFINEALLSSLIKATARQFVKTKALQKAVPKATTIPVRNYWSNKPVVGLSVASKAPEKVKLASTITGFRSGGANRGSNFDPMKGSKYQFDPVKQTSISNTAPGHISTPAGIKPKSSHTRFGTPSEIATAKQKGDLRPLGKTPKIGLSPYEKWKTGDYPAGVEYAKGKFSKPNWSPSHMGSPIVDIQTRTGSKSNLPLFGAERKEIRDRVKTALSKPQNITALKREIKGIKPTTYRNLGAGRKEGIKEQRSFCEFIIEARRKVKVLRTAHYTSASNKNEILKGGFKDSPSTGTYHPDDRKGIVYTTPSSRVGSDYGHSRVNLKVVNPKMKNTDSPRDFGKNIKSWMASSSIEDINDKKGKPTSAVDQARSSFKRGDKVVRVPNAHGGFTPRPGQAQGSYIMMDKEVANKSIDKNPSPTMRAKGKGKRSKTQPKKDT